MKLLVYRILVLGSLHLCCLVTSSPVQAQISSDGTVPTNVNQIGKVTEITGGTQAGSNLFHSFQEFSVPTGSEAFFKNATNASEITNIISRVTGGSISIIDGLIKENYGANLILINPSGIHFGPNAQLNIGGSFLGSTASSLKFADGTEFSATNSQTSPRLTISVPIGLQFGQNPGTIRVQGMGHDLMVANPIFSPVTRDNNSTGLQVQSGQTLALVGGNISVEGGMLTAESGRVELGSVAEGLVSLSLNPSGWTLGYEGVSAFQDIEMRSQALADVSGVSGGSIQVQGRNLSIRDGSLILIQNQGLQPAGTIQVNTSESVKVSGTNSNGTVRSSLTNETVGLGRGGDVNISTRDLSVEEGGTIVAKTLSPAIGGNVNVNASGSLQVLGASTINPSVTSSIVAATFGAGNSGNNTVSAGRLTARGGGTIATATFGTGQGGNLNVNAGDSVDIIGVEPNLFAPSGLLSSTFNAGNAGDVKINTPKLRVQDGGRVGASTSASGSAGNITINAPELVEVKGRVPGSVNPSLINSSANRVDRSLQQLFGLPPVPNGSSKDVTITTNELRVTDGALVSTSSDGSGISGNVRINAGSVLLDSGGAIASELGRALRQGPFSFSSPLTSAVGKGGDIEISTKQMVVQGGASISTLTFTNVNGGNVILNAPESLQVVGFTSPNPRVQTFISSSTFGSGDSGNIDISTGKFTIQNGGLLTAGTQGSGEGGDLRVTATDSVEVIGAEPTRLAPSLIGVSSLNRGNGGNLTINTPRLIVRDGGRIDSSTGASGSAGSVTINSPQSVEVTGTIPGTSTASLISAGANIESEITRRIFGLPDVPSGASGDLTINTGQLRISNSAQVTARNQGSGNAGNAKVNARSILLDDVGSITAATTSGEGGNIILQTNSLQMRHNSQISAEAGGTGNGGNITITGFSPAEFVVLLEDSKINANAFEGRGGNIQINTQGLFACPECKITASSQLGLDGVVEVITPDAQTKQEALDLPQEVVKPEEVVAQVCPANSAQARSEFTLTGRGGLPPRPNEPLSREALVSFGSSPNQAENSSQSARSTLPPPAQGWYLNSKGALILTAHAPTLTPYNSGLASSSCHDN
jgi:filamentous hemagglutinin family protein